MSVNSSNSNSNIFDPGYNYPGVIISRTEALFNKAVFTSDEFVADADVANDKKRQEKINEINTEVERRKSTYKLL